METTQETNNTTVDTEVSQIEVSSSPSILDFFKAGWKFTKNRKDIVGWYIGTLALMAVFTSETFGDLFDSPAVTLLAAIAIFVTAIFLILNSWSVLYVVSQDDTDSVSYKEAFSWASGNFFPLLWTSIVSFVTILVGYFLLIIPGIIALVYFYFSLYVQATGGGVGTEAMKASYRVVKGSWWQTAWKLVILGFYAVLVYIVAGILLSIIFAIGDQNVWVQLVADVLVQGLVGGVVSVISMFVLAKYYKHLVSSNKTHTPKSA